MALNDREMRTLRELEEVPLETLSTANKDLLDQLRRRAVLGDDDVAMGAGSIGAMIDIGAGRILPAKQATSPRPSGRELPCPVCGTPVRGIRGVGKKYYKCLCGRKWTGPTSTRISSIDPSDPSNQPIAETVMPPSEDEVSHTGSAQRFRILARRIDQDE